MLSKHLQKWMWVTYVTKTRSYTHHKFVTYVTHIWCVIYITQAWHVQRDATRYIYNMRTYVTNKLRQRVTRKTFYIQNNCQESKILPFSLLLNFLHPLVPSWNMWNMTCPTRCYKEIHCYICNVRTDVTNKVQRKRLPEKIF